jgi:hypothetical protein
VNELLNRWLDVLDVERKPRAGYVSKVDKHNRPTRRGPGHGADHQGSAHGIRGDPLEPVQDRVRDQRVDHPVDASVKHTAGNRHRLDFPVRTGRGEEHARDSLIPRIRRQISPLGRGNVATMRLMAAWRRRLP